MLRVTTPDLPKSRAEGNLSYLQFIALVEYLWEKSHPDIPVVPTQSPKDLNLPVIVYGLEIRRAMVNEPKMRLREEVINDGGQSYLIHGQRFENIVTFSVVETDPKMADEIIEVFEDFMLEFTPVFKRLGVSEFVYARRTPDNEPFAGGEDLVKRTVAYKLTTEKIRLTPVDLIERILIDLRIYLAEGHARENLAESATPAQAELVDLYGSATPL